MWLSLRSYGTDQLNASGPNPWSEGAGNHSCSSNELKMTSLLSPIPCLCLAGQKVRKNVWWVSTIVIKLYYIHQIQLLLKTPSWLWQMLNNLLARNKRPNQSRFLHSLTPQILQDCHKECQQSGRMGTWGYVSERGESDVPLDLFASIHANSYAQGILISHWGPGHNALGMKCTELSLELLSWSLSPSFSHRLATWQGHQRALCPHSWWKQLHAVFLSTSEHLSEKIASMEPEVLPV